MRKIYIHYNTPLIVFFIVFNCFSVRASEPIVLEVDGYHVFAPHTCMLGTITSLAKKGHPHTKHGTTRWVHKDINACTYRLRKNPYTTTISVEYQTPKHILYAPFPLLASFTNATRTPMSDLLYDGTPRSTDLIYSTYMVARYGHHVLMSKHTLTLNTAQFIKLRAATIAARDCAEKMIDKIPVKPCQIIKKPLTLLDILTESKESKSCKKSH